MHLLAEMTWPGVAATAVVCVAVAFIVWITKPE